MKKIIRWLYGEKELKFLGKFYLKLGYSEEFGQDCSEENFDWTVCSLDRSDNDVDSCEFCFQ